MNGPLLAIRQLRLFGNKGRPWEQGPRASLGLWSGPTGEANGAAFLAPALNTEGGGAKVVGFLTGGASIGNAQLALGPLACAGSPSLDALACGRSPYKLAMLTADDCSGQC